MLLISWAYDIRIYRLIEVFYAFDFNSGNTSEL